MDDFAVSIIKKFLTPIGLCDNYYRRFESQGYDCEEDLCMLDGNDLDQMHINDTLHRHKILSAAKTWYQTGSGEVYHWLRKFYLERYHSQMIQSGYDSLYKLKKIVQEDDFMDEVEIMIPGHRKRLSRMIGLLKEAKMGITEAEEPIGIGIWCKFEALGQAEHEVLCINAAIRSPRLVSNDAACHISTNFMVDTGSDVVTVQSDIVERLHLPVVRTVRSHGVHSIAEKQLFTAVFVIKDVELVIEVMEGSYNSVGVCVMRHFRHYINDKIHFWLKKRDDDD